MSKKIQPKSNNPSIQTTSLSSHRRSLLSLRDRVQHPSFFAHFTTHFPPVSLTSPTPRPPVADGHNSGRYPGPDVGPETFSSAKITADWDLRLAGSAGGGAPPTLPLDPVELSYAENVELRMRDKEFCTA